MLFKAVLRQSAYPLAFLAIVLGVWFMPPPNTWFGPSTSAELSFANGTYKHSCCAPIVLADGVLTAGEALVNSVIDRAPPDQGGAVFLRTEKQVHIAKGAQVVVTDEPYPSSLVMDKDNTPPRTILVQGEGMKDYSFVRAD